MALQLSFLAQPERRLLVADASGRIEYVRGFIDAPHARDLFESLKAGVDWKSERRPMYDRVVDVPRLVASYSLDDPQAPQELAVLRAPLEEFCQVSFTRTGLNLYRDGRDSVAPHGDHTEMLDPAAPVALLSLGAERIMTIRSKAKPRRALDLELEPGSLLVMDYQSQLAWEHGIPKTRRPSGMRISVAFRRGVDGG